MRRKAKRVAAEVERTTTEAMNSEPSNKSVEGLNEMDAVEVGAAFETEPYDGASAVAVDEFEAVGLEGIETTLDDADEAALEAGIASVFDAILAEGFEMPVAENDDDAASEDDADENIADAEGADPTFALLAELNRLWAQPLAA
jgi:hypothetical protein